MRLRQLCPVLPLLPSSSWPLLPAVSREKMGRKRKRAGQLLGSPHAAAFNFLAEEKRCSGLALLSSPEHGFHFGFSK